MNHDINIKLSFKRNDDLKNINELARKGLESVGFEYVSDDYDTFCTGFKDENYIMEIIDMTIDGQLVRESGN
jgi:hypothetical protein